jgi:hypothetical protein
MLQGGEMQWKQWEYRIVVGVIFKFFSGSDAGGRYSKSDTSGISNC